MVVLGGGAVYYGRGTPVQSDRFFSPVRTRTASYGVDGVQEKDLQGVLEPARQVVERLSPRDVVHLFLLGGWFEA